MQGAFAVDAQPHLSIFNVQIRRLCDQQFGRERPGDLTIAPMLSALSIFAGVNAKGELRFVGDVPRGAACGCRCVACGAALIARRGEIRNWHFAHEASQERPDCFAGAVNLLRRLAIERLIAVDVPPLPIYSSRVSSTFPLPVLSETVIWTPPAFRVERLDRDAPATAPIALLRLANGTLVRLFVDVGSSARPRLQDITAEEGVLVLQLPLPFTPDQLRDRAAAIRHIDESSELIWLQCPDAERVRAATRADLNRRAQKVLDESAALRRIAGNRQSPVPAPALEPPASLRTAAPRVEEIDTSPWAAWRKRPHAFLFYGLKDGSAWVIFPHRDGRTFMMPYPHAFEGWDEAMPAHIGTPDHELGGYLVNKQLSPMTYLGNLSRIIRTPSNWTELLQLPWQH